jgi:hypothetical protein
MCHSIAHRETLKSGRKSGHFWEIGGATRRRARVPSRVAQYFANLKEGSELFRAFAYSAACHIKS